MTETDSSNLLLTIALIVFYWQLIRIWCQPPPPPGRRDESAGGKSATPLASAFTGPGLARRPTLQSGDARPSTRLAPAAQGKDGLATIRGSDPAFDQASFLAGAALAYERVVVACARQELAGVERLLDPAVRSGFENAAADCGRNGEGRDFAFVGLKETEIVGATEKAGVAEISVRFVGEVSGETWSADGSLLCGDPGKIVETADVWTFSRRLAARDPNWIIVATECE